MPLDDAKLLDYIENNLNPVEKQKYEAEILSNPELQKKVKQIQEGLELGASAYKQEKETDDIDFSNLRSKIDAEVDNEYKKISSLKKKIKLG